MSSRWIVKVTADSEQWPNDEMTDTIKASIRGCDIVVDEIMPMGIPGYYRFSVATDLSPQQQDCITSVDSVLSLTADSVMRRAKPES